MTDTLLQRKARAPQARQISRLATRLTSRSEVKAQSAGRSHKLPGLAKSVTVE